MDSTEINRLDQPSISKGDRRDMINLSIPDVSVRILDFEKTKSELFS